MMHEFITYSKTEKDQQTVTLINFGGVRKINDRRLLSLKGVLLFVAVLFLCCVLVCLIASNRKHILFNLNSEGISKTSISSEVSR